MGFQKKKKVVIAEGTFERRNNFLFSRNRIRIRKKKKKGGGREKKRIILAKRNGGKRTKHKPSGHPSMRLNLKIGQKNSFLQTVREKGDAYGGGGDPLERWGRKGHRWTRDMPKRNKTGPPRSLEEKKRGNCWVQKKKFDKKAPEKRRGDRWTRCEQGVPHKEV